jgi:hypothetical protein
VRPEFAAAVEMPPEGDAAAAEIEIGFRARIEFHRSIDNWETAASLEPLHIWRPEEIRKRFEGDETPGISLAFVRIYRLSSPWRFPNEKTYGGCRSWVDLPEAPGTMTEVPVLTDAAHAVVRDKVLSLIA